MKRSILVLMIVVFALVSVVPAFAMPQDFHGVTVPQVIDPNDSVVVHEVVDPNDSIVMPDGVIIIDGVIIWDGGDVKAGIIVEYASMNAVRKAGGTQQDYL